MNIAFIPARGGSKSIKKKNIKSFSGKPLIYWCLKALQEAQKIDCIYVATDCNEIEKTALSFGFDKIKIYRRSAENAQDTSSTESVVLEFIEKNSFDPETHFTLVQATCPFVQAHHYDDAFRLLQYENSDSLLSCARQKHFFWDHTNTPINYDIKKRPRRQDFAGVFMENGAFYINSVENILREKNRLTGKISIYEMPSYTAQDIDEEDDWIVCEILMKKHNLK